MTCILCLTTAYYIDNFPVFIVTWASFIVALAHFSTELFVFKTTNFKKVSPTVIVAGVSSVWMGWLLWTEQVVPQ